MTTHVHPTAVVDARARLASGVRVGPHAVIGAEVEIGEDSEIGAGAVVLGPSTLGRENRIFPHSCIGFEPQDLKFHGERTTLEIGDRNQFREFSTVHRGTGSGGGLTRVGSDGLFMAYTHIAHDSWVGDRVIFANNATLAGHVRVDDDASVGALTAVHQFCRVGRHAYIGGYSVITQDALPFVKTVGVKPAFYGLNRIGLERKGVPAETIERLEVAVRRLSRSRQPLDEMLASLRTEFPDDADVAYLVDFVESAQRGVIRALPGRKASNRGG